MNEGEHDTRLKTVWQFVRGDMAPSDFAQWVYAQTALESRLGETLYFETIATDYSCAEAVRAIREHLAQYAITTVRDLDCRCIQLRDLDVVDMEMEYEDVFRTLEEIRARGDPYWWLSVHRCRQCAQWWLVAQEGRQNDVFCIRRLDENAAERLLRDNRWPEDFDRYETLLRVGRDAGKRFRFTDPLNSSLS